MTSPCDEAKDRVTAALLHYRARGEKARERLIASLDEKSARPALGGIIARMAACLGLAATLWWVIAPPSRERVASQPAASGLPDPQTLSGEAADFATLARAFHARAQEAPDPQKDFWLRAAKALEQAALASSRDDRALRDQALRDVAEAVKDGR